MASVVLRVNELRAEGNAKLEKGEAEAALALYDEAADLARQEAKTNVESFAAVLKNGAAAALQAGKFETAAQRASEAIGVEGPSVTALYRRAVARRKTFDFEGAYEDLVEALELDSNEPLLRQEMLHLRRAYMASSDAVPATKLASVAEKLGVSAEDLRNVLEEPFYACRAAESSSLAAAAKETLDAEVAATSVERVEICGKMESCQGVTTNDEKAVLRSSSANAPPWQLDVVVHPLPESPYAAAEGLRFRLVFVSGTRLPKVRSVSLLQHSLFCGPQGSHNAHHARRAVLDFYEALETLTLTSVLTLIRDSLDGPKGRQWHRYARQFAERRTVIDAFVQKHHHTLPELYTEDVQRFLFDDMLAPTLRDALVGGGDPTSVCETVGPGVFAFDLFAPKAATRLLSEIDCFYASGLPAQRPNSMNAYGVIVNDIGLETFVSVLQQKVFSPLAKRLFSAEHSEHNGHPGAAFDSHHAFIVRYRRDEDSHLDIHTDDSDVTFNVSLGREGFDGSNLIFCGMIGAKDHRQHCVSYRHQLGKCVVHLGNRRHGTDDIQQGERLNLIVWCHSLAWRDSAGATHHNRNFQEEDQPPDPRCVSYTHDRDFGRFKPYPPDRAHFKGKGWCPPPGAEYPGFQAE